MDRITRRLDNGSIEFVDGKGYGSYSYEQGVRLLFERLAKYEDIGLTPEDVSKLKKTTADFNLSFSEVIEKLEDGQIAECDKIYIVKRNENFYSGTDVNTTINLEAESYDSSKWRITPFFEQRFSNCENKYPLLPLTEAYSNGAVIWPHHLNYYEHKKECKLILGLIE